MTADHTSHTGHSSHATPTAPPVTAVTASPRTPNCPAVVQPPERGQFRLRGIASGPGNRASTGVLASDGWPWFGSPEGIRRRRGNGKAVSAGGPHPSRTHQHGFALHARPRLCRVHRPAL